MCTSSASASQPGTSWGHTHPLRVPPSSLPARLHPVVMHDCCWKIPCTSVIFSADYRYTYVCTMHVCILAAAVACPINSIPRRACAVVIRTTHADSSGTRHTHTHTRDAAARKTPPPGEPWRGLQAPSASSCQGCDDEGACIACQMPVDMGRPPWSSQHAESGPDIDGRYPSNTARFGRPGGLWPVGCALHVS